MSILLAKLLNYRPALLGSAESQLRRFVTLTGRTISWLLIHVLLATAIMLPFDETANADSTSSWIKPAPGGNGTDTASDTTPSAWHNWASDSSHWTTYPAIGVLASPVAVPTDNFQLIGRGTFKPGATGGVDVSAEMISGDKWITLGQETVGTAGISNQDISSAMRKFPRNSAYIFAQYSPENAEGRIVIQKVEKMPDGAVNVYQADFTPWSGELWKAQGKYRTAQEISYGDPGYNPFANFEGATTDPVFHNISQGAMEVAVGHAMRRYGVAFAYVAVGQALPLVQNTSTHQMLFKNKVTITVSGYAQPVWLVATPPEATSVGETGQVCVLPAPQTCNPPVLINGVLVNDPHVAVAGVMFSPWTGGNMPQNQDLMYTTTTTQSSWNVLFYAAISALGFGLIGATIYAMASGRLTQSQNGYLGATGNGFQLKEAATGAQLGLNDSIQANHIAAPMGSGGMQGTDQLYKGGCPANLSVADCQNHQQDPGTIWRPDSYAEYNSTKAMRDRYKACLAAGYTGVQAEQCAAPSAYAIQ